MNPVRPRLPGDLALLSGYIVPCAPASETKEAVHSECTAPLCINRAKQQQMGGWRDADATINECCAERMEACQGAHYVRVKKC